MGMTVCTRIVVYTRENSLWFNTVMSCGQSLANACTAGTLCMSMLCSHMCPVGGKEKVRRWREFE